MNDDLPFLVRSSNYERDYDSQDCSCLDPSDASIEYPCDIR
jgi:hypothetical protein